jgi:uncharacterized protein YhaN
VGHISSSRQEEPTGKLGRRMRILRLDLQAFGPFSGTSLELSAGNEGIHLIYGPNEAGKSSTLRALRNLLYGIPGNTVDDFVHNKPDLRVGALLRRRDGQELEIVRRKGYKGTLLSPDEKDPLDESVLRGFLGGCDQAQFETMFGIDHAGLIAGGQEIIRGQGDIGHVLFAAGAGIADLRTIRGNLEREADELFRPGGQKPAVNQAVSELNKAKKLIRDSLLPGSDWLKHKTALDDAGKQLAAIEDQLGELSRRKTRLERLARALPGIARLRDCDERLARLGDVPELPDDFAENRRDTTARLETARQAEQEAVAEIERLDALIAEATMPEALTSHTADIEATYSQLGVYRKAQADLPGLIAKQEHLAKETAALLKELRPELSLGNANELKLTRRQQVEIQNLGSRKEALGKQLLQARNEIVETRQSLREASDELAQLPPSSDPTSLAEAVRQARSQGNLSQQASSLRNEIASLSQQASVDLQQLGLWSGPLASLETLALPATETIDRFDQGLSEVQAEISRGQSAMEKARSEASGIDRELERLRLEGDPPSEAELAKARKLRDAGWQLFLKERRNEMIPVEAMEDFLAAIGPGERPELVSAYEQAVRRADDLADRLRREANRVASRASLQSQQASVERQLADLTRQHASALEQFQEVECQWRRAWQPAAIDPLPPREMRAWMQRRQGLVQQAQAIRLRAAELKRLDSGIAEQCGRLRAGLERFGISDGNTASLDSLLARGDAVLEQTKEAAGKRRQLEHEKNRLLKAAAQAEAKAAQAEAEVKEWSGQWTDALRPLGLPEGVSPAAANVVVAQTDELFARLREAAGFAERIDDIARDSSHFCQSVHRLLLTIGPEPPPDDRLEEALERLMDRLRRAISDQEKLDLLESQRKNHDEIRRQAHDKVEELRASLAVMCREARCLSADELPAAEAASLVLLRLRQERKSSHEQLLQLAAGATIDDLVAEAAAISADSLPGELQRLTEEIADGDRKRGELREAIGGEKRALDGMDTSALAAEAAEEAQAMLARLEPDARRYLRLRLASAVLRDAIERYRKKNEGPVLRRASELFRRLTLGSFESLRIDFGERGEQLLAGVRPDGKTILPAAMSEGTCDQLYLALRLASLETWLERNEPMPLVVDDILVSFDNRRAAATLEVLAELSTRTQVIFFTHHEHLVELAGQSVPKEVLSVHRLS